MKELNEAIAAALSYDSIADAEQRMGISYKEDERVVWASMPLMQDNQKTKEELFTLTDDTHWGLEIPEWKRLLGRLGFQMVLEDALSEGNFYRIFWHPDGIVLSSDSYFGDKSVNGGGVYLFCKGENVCINTSTGGSTNPLGDNVYGVSRDIREGLRFFLNLIRDTGEILPVWPKMPFLWLLSYEDSKVEGYDYKAITMARINRLPEEVKNCILGTES